MFHILLLSDFSCTCGGGDRSKCLKACSIVDGTSLNEGDCGCGSINCNAATGYYCLALSNKCAKIKIHSCENTESSTANSGTCSCGSSECDATKGLFCLASSSKCQKIRFCSNTMGNIANSEPCMCGSTECDASKGLFCNSESSECRKVLKCSNEDGSVINSETCFCGDRECDATEGLFCNDVPSNPSKCQKILVCSNQLGSIVNIKTCTCGSSTCDVASGFFCGLFSNKCAKAKIDIPLLTHQFDNIGHHNCETDADLIAGYRAWCSNTKDMSISSDGKNVYVMSSVVNVPFGHIVSWKRNLDTGRLTDKVVYKPEEYANSLAISPDNKNVYALGNKIVYWQRNVDTGALSNKIVLEDNKLIHQQVDNVENCGVNCKKIVLGNQIVVGKL